MSAQMINSAVEAARAHPELPVAVQDVMDSIFRRSTTDHAFRTKLLSDSKAALSEFAGRAMPESLNVKFIERQGDVTIVLPHAVESAAQLSDSELETVAGGSLLAAAGAACVASSAECVAAGLAVGAAVLHYFDN